MGDIMKYDKIINVAIGKSRKELNYVNLKLPYSEFIDKYIKNSKKVKFTYLNFIASALILIAGIILLYIAISDKDLDIEIAFV